MPLPDVCTLQETVDRHEEEVNNLYRAVSENLRHANNLTEEQRKRWQMVQNRLYNAMMELWQASNTLKKL